MYLVPMALGFHHIQDQKRADSLVRYSMIYLFRRCPVYGERIINKRCRNIIPKLTVAEQHNPAAHTALPAEEPQLPPAFTSRTSSGRWTTRSRVCDVVEDMNRAPAIRKATNNGINIANECMMCAHCRGRAYRCPTYDYITGTTEECQGRSLIKTRYKRAHRRTGLLGDEYPWPTRH